MRKTIAFFLFALVATVSMAQIDVTKYYLANAGFDTNIDYPKTSTTEVKEEELPVEGWTAELSAAYTIVGTYEFGFKGKFNTASVPAVGFDGEAGAGLAISTGWSQTFKFYQTVTLPAGTYTLSAPTYNGSSVAAATSQLAWIPNSGTAVTSSVTSYKTNGWTEDKITFTLTKTTTGKIQFGMKAADGGSTNTAKLVIDYIKLIGENMVVDKTTLNSSITSANKYYGDGTGNGAAALKTAIDVAQAISDNADATLVEVLDGKIDLDEAVEAYRKLNVSEENPLDYTSYITNPSFETEGTKGWVSDGLVTQTNTSFTKKKGSVYLEKWVQTAPVGSGYINQVITVPNGKYKLTVAAQNYTQSSTTKKNTGAIIYANDIQETVYTPNDYSVKFTSIAGEVEIGFKAENATGNWICVDNFRLYYIGDVTTDEVMAEVTRNITDAEALQASMMSASAATALQKTIDAGKLITSSSTDADVQSAIKNLRAAVTAAQTSAAEYKALADAIANAEKSYDETKNGAADFRAILDEAAALAANPEATSDALKGEITTLDKAVLAFNLANATHGAGTAVKVTATNHYVPTGSTEAIMRATMTGSNVLERGICWSTEHNPTVLDNRTTEYHTLNGNIYHVRNLTPATVYYLRPYVMNKTYEVAYGDEVKIVTHPKGTCVGTWNEGAPDEAANKRCRDAINQTIEYFNQWTGIRGFHLTGNYGAGTPTADCSYGGWMRIGPNAGNQAIGTVIHETGHGVGVGTSARWSDKNVHNWKWYGREANAMYSFLENKTADPYNSEFCMVGDGMHGWGASASYDWFVNGADKDKHLELQYLGGCVLLYAMFIDGLCPTSAYTNGLSGYTYNFDSDKRYYIRSESNECGLLDGFLYQRTATAVSWRPMTAEEAANDANQAAWYIEYDAEAGYYRFRNAVTGKYLTHTSTGTSVTVASKKNPSVTENFQLMPGRPDVTIGSGSTAIKTYGYWFTWENGGNKAMQMKEMNTFGYGSNTVANFSFTDAAANQRYIIFSEDELEAYDAARIAVGIESPTADNKEGTTPAIRSIHTADGIAVSSPRKGINIVTYSDGTTKKVLVK